MLNWNFKEAITCLGQEVNYNIQTLMTKYKTENVLIKGTILTNEHYRLEVWYNFNSACCVINAFIEGDFEYEGDTMIDADVSEI